MYSLVVDTHLLQHVVRACSGVWQSFSSVEICRKGLVAEQAQQGLWYNTVGKVVTVGIHDSEVSQSGNLGVTRQLLCP